MLSYLQGRLKRSYNSRVNIFLRYLIVLLVIVLFPTIFIGIIWFQNIKQTNQNQILLNEKQCMNEVTEEVNRSLKVIEKDLISILYGATYRSYMTNSSPVEMKKLMSQLTETVNQNQSLYSIYLYDMRSDEIWDSHSRLQQVEMFYDTSWMENFNVSIRMQTLPSRENLDEEFEKNLTSDMGRYYAKRDVFSVVTPKELGALLVANIDIDSLGKQLTERFYTNGKEVYIGTEKDILYASQGAQSDMKPALDQWTKENGIMEYWGEDQAWFACSIEGTDLFYIESIPIDILYRNTTEYGYYIIKVVGVLMLAMIVLASLITGRMYQPLDELYSILKHSKGNSTLSYKSEEDESIAIKKAFQSIQKSPDSVEVSYQREGDLVSGAMLRMLIDGMITQEYFIQENEKVFGEDSSKQKYGLLLCKLKEGFKGKDREQKTIQLKEVINVYLVAHSKGIIAETSNQVFTVLYSGISDDEIKSTEAFLIKVFNDLTGVENYFGSCMLFIEKESIQDKYMAYLKAVQNKYFFLEETDTVVALVPEKQEYSYKTLLRYAPSLIRGIVLGDENAILEKVNELSTELLENRQKEYAQNLCARILGEIDKELVLERTFGENVDPIRRTYEMETLPQLLEYLVVVFKAKMNVLNKENKSVESKYYQNAIEYMQHNYMKNINITEVADALGISYVYLNKIFKNYQENDMRMIDYLNLIRINKASELLSQTELSMASIAEQVGYNNVQSFLRFFKKYKEMTPSDYRKKYNE